MQLPGVPGQMYPTASLQENTPLPLFMLGIEQVFNKKMTDLAKQGYV